MSAFAKIFLTALVAATLAPLATAHSWVEEYQVISSNGSYVGARGFSRGYLGRTDPGYDGNSDMWMLPALGVTNADGTTRTRINSSDLVCHPAQRTSNYTQKYPKLQVQPGDYVAMKYLENGHVSLPWNITGKPAGTGTIFVFGTTNAKDDEKIIDVMKWTSDGKGGDGRGFLMTAQNFDDGRCTQINCGSISQYRQALEPNHIADQPTSSLESWCETDLKIPENTKAGTLTTYWIWQWPTEPNMDCNTPAGKDEYYTTCADFDVKAAGTANKAAQAPFSASAGENPQSVAVSSYKSRTAYTTTASVIAMENNKIVGKLASVDSAFVSSCSAQASVISANSLGLWPEVFVPTSCGIVSSFGPAAASSIKAAFNKGAASYTAQASSAWNAAFAAAKMPAPSRAPWSQAPETGAQMTAYSTPAPTASSPAAASSSAPAASSPAAASSSSSAAAAPSSPAAAPYGNGSGSAVTSVYTVTTILTLTSTLPPGQTAPSGTAPAASSPSAPAASSPAPAADTNGMMTVTTVTGAASSAAGYRRHARAFA